MKYGIKIKQLRKNKSKTLKKHVPHADFYTLIYHLSYKAKRAGGEPEKYIESMRCLWMYELKH